MPRTARVVIPDLAHHVTQRGNNRQDVFFVEDDYRQYLEQLRIWTGRYEVRVVGYCLMTNHVHLVLRPRTAKGLSKAVGLTHYWYTQYVNRLHGRCGHLWQNRFYSCPLDERHQWLALRYVERNPVRARLVRSPWKYPWSSAQAHCAGADDAGVLDVETWSTSGMAEGWAEELRTAESDAERQSLVHGLRTGRPLGSDSFLSKLESKVGRRLRPLPPGRPRKQDQAARLRDANNR